MSGFLIVLLLIVAAVASLVFSTISYAARDLSRAKLEEALERRGREGLLDTLYRSADDIAFVAAVLRLVANLATLMLMLRLTGAVRWQDVGVAFALAGALTVVTSVVLPHGIALHLGAGVIAAAAGPLRALRTAAMPLVAVARAVDFVFDRLTGTANNGGVEEPDEDYEAEILSYAAEGEQEGVIDASERRMIEQVIAFGDRTVRDAMTSRPDVIALAYDTPLPEVRETAIQSGHSRIPVFDDDLDVIKGVLYARDLLRVGSPEDGYTIDDAMRPAHEVPESMRLGDLLTDFRQRKVHIGVVRDEHGAVSGIITIEDVLEQLVGEISDEHEPVEPERINVRPDGTADCDARVTVAEVNRELGLTLPEDEEYDTLAGFVMSETSGIPAAGASFTRDGTRFRVTEAERHRLKRIEVRRGQRVSA